MEIYTHVFAIQKKVKNGEEFQHFNVELYKAAFMLKLFFWMAQYVQSQTPISWQALASNQLIRGSVRLL